MTLFVLLQEFLYSGRKGWLVSLLKSRRTKDNAVRPQNLDDEADEETEPMEYSADEAAQDVEYLKMTTYDTNTAEIMEEKIKLTAKYRHNKLSETGVNIVKQFPFFIAHPHLVICLFLFNSFE